jgi:hypothetical protein
MLRMFHDSGFSNNHNEAVRLAAELPRYGINVPARTTLVGPSPKASFHADLFFISLLRLLFTQWASALTTTHRLRR